VPVSFPIGIKAVFNEEVASIRVPNNTPVDQLERLLSTRRGVPVKLADGEPTMWLPNKEYRFVSVHLGQKAAMTEAMIEENAQPTELELLVTVCDRSSRYPLPVRVPTDATWDQLMLTWRAKVCAKDPEMTRFPGVGTAYHLKTETGDPVASMDNLSKVYTHFIPTMIPQPGSDGTVKVKLIYHTLDCTRKYVKLNTDLRVLPDESEQELLDRWFEAVREARVKCSSTWQNNNNNDDNNDTFPWSGPSGVLGCTRQRPVGVSILCPGEVQLHSEPGNLAELSEEAPEGGISISMVCEGSMVYEG
jgi:hypothetical protein